MSIQTYHTATGSIYEVDEANKQIRRMHGTHPPRSRQGVDGEWKQYEELHKYLNGLLIVWEVIDGVSKSTLTSQLVEAPAAS